MTVYGSDDQGDDGADRRELAPTPSSPASPTSSSQSPLLSTVADEVSHRDPGYFQYYAQLQHQQNMLQDYMRTSTYFSAITQAGAPLFLNSVVMDVGAGSGILSYFAAQAGARKVYAVEASKMANKMRVMLDAARGQGAGRHPARNGYLQGRIEIIESKVEDIRQEIDKVDVIISEPIGVLLVHERMLESFIYARDKYLKPTGGVVYPSSGSIHLAPVSDAALWSETMSKVRFWEQSAFYGVDLRPFMELAYNEYFTAPVVGCFNPRSLMADCCLQSRGYTVDFNTVTAEEIKSFRVPIEWDIKYTGIIHAIGGWFDIAFTPPTDATLANPLLSEVRLSTSPSNPATHWQQVRLLLATPLAVNIGQKIMGYMEFRANEYRSYDLSAEIAIVLPSEQAEIARRGYSSLPSIEQSRRASGKWYLHQQVYNYSYTDTDAANDLKPEFLSLYLTQQQIIDQSNNNNDNNLGYGKNGIGDGSGGKSEGDLAAIEGLVVQLNDTAGPAKPQTSEECSHQW